MRTVCVIAATTALLGACATTRVATAEERAQCTEMAQRMGTATYHDHSEERGQTGRSWMNRQHDRCQEIARADARALDETEDRPH